MVKPYRCPSCRLSHFDEIMPRAYKCNWCGDAFTEQDVVEDGGYHPFEDEREYVEVDLIEPPDDLPNIRETINHEIRRAIFGIESFIV